MPGILSGFDVSASAMEAQRIRLNTISSNLANANTTRGLQGGPYRRRDVVFESALAVGDGGLVPVRVAGVIEDPRPFKTVYEPGHPDADPNGYVELPNVNAVEEMVNMLSAIRAYEANATAFNSSKEMMMKALEIGR
ncbi:MAG: flagellar basal body rod protein FlgC [Deltaproteobacteria bacterium]|nr:flagellar basal body rod protein FlgC [Deltaproteobacteria bacterium]